MNRAGRGPVTTCSGWARAQGRATTRVAPTMRSAWAPRWVPGIDHLSRFPRGSCRRRTGGKRPGNDRDPTPVGAPLVGALRGRNVVPADGCTVNRAGRGPVTTCSGWVRVQGRATTRVAPTMRAPRWVPGDDHLSRFPRGSCRRRTGGKRPGNVRDLTPVGSPLVGALRGRNVVPPDDRTVNRAGRGPVTRRGVRGRAQGRGTTRVAPTMRAPRWVPGDDHLSLFPRGACWRRAGGKATWKRPTTGAPAIQIRPRTSCLG